tara:strand:+ start:1618 stop:2844 length:1227 start_codon:yes stop_codon:yes gene_type:complete
MNNSHIVPVDVEEKIIVAKESFKGYKGPPLNHQFVNTILKLENNHASMVLSHVFSNINESNLNATRLSTWHYRSKKIDVYETALMTRINNKKNTNLNLLVIYYLHLSRQLRFSEILEFARSDSTFFKLYKQRMFLFRSYLLNMSDIPRYKPARHDTLPIEISEIIPVFNEIDPLQKLKKNAALSQLAAAESTYTSLPDISDTARELILKEIIDENDPFAQSLKKISRAKSIAVVLKGPSLSKRNIGFLVDQHDLVIRVNLSNQSDGAVYGKRTDILFYASFLRNKVQYSATKAVSEVEFLPQSNQTNQLIERNKRIKAILSSISYEHSTTGFAAILISLLLCEGQVTVFGFDSYSPSQGEFLRLMPNERSKYYLARDLAAPTHEIDYENWFIHRFCRDFLFESKLSLI